ncbi:hypothetical protein B0H13DRAFT_1882113 [Mycena leptocephala]|nr:hypothetical protein B0H13DRAFT_1882113 [Mycena leptocephala]
MREKGRDRPPSKASDDLYAMLLESVNGSPRPHASHRSSTSHPHIATYGRGGGRGAAGGGAGGQGAPARAGSVDDRGRAYPQTTKKGTKDLHAPFPYSAGKAPASVPLVAVAGEMPHEDEVSQVARDARAADAAASGGRCVQRTPTIPAAAPTTSTSSFTPAAATATPYREHEPPQESSLCSSLAEPAAASHSHPTQTAGRIIKNRLARSISAPAPTSSQSLSPSIATRHCGAHLNVDGDGDGDGRRETVWMRMRRRRLIRLRGRTRSRMHTTREMHTQDMPTTPTRMGEGMKMAMGSRMGMGSASRRRFCWRR